MQIVLIKSHNFIWIFSRGEYSVMKHNDKIIRGLSGIQTHEPSVRADEDYCDEQL
jgi:hypothetical protein